MSERLRGSRDEAGSSLIEVLLLGVGLLLPLSLSISAMGNAQRAALAVSAATRDAARAASTSRTPSEARDRALQAAFATLEAYGLSPSAASVRVDGELRRGGRIGLSVTYPVTVEFAGIFQVVTPLQIGSKIEFSVGVHYPARR